MAAHGAFFNTRNDVIISITIINIYKQITWLYEDIVKTNFHEKKGFYRLMVTRMKNYQWMTTYLS